MAAALVARPYLRHELTTEDSARILADLVAQRRPVRIRWDESVDVSTWWAVGTGAADDELLFELTEGAWTDPRGKPAASLSVEFETGGACYRFECMCHTVDRGGRAVRLRMKRPRQLAVLERRRSPRHGLRRAIDVRVRTAGDRRSIEVTGALLNLSVDGMACRVCGPKSRFSMGDDLRVLFELEGPDTRFDLGACVVNMTGGASADVMILGLRFIPDALSPVDRDRLVAALGRGGTA